MPNQSSPMAPHVLIFPLPLQGPLNCMLNLAELLCLAGVGVTFINTDHVHRRLLACSTSANYYAKYPNLKFQTVPDGLPEENPRTADQIGNLIESMEAVASPIFRQMVSPDSVSCLIADGIFAFAAEVAGDVGVPLLYFDTISPCGLWSYLCMPKLIEDGEFPFPDDDLDKLVPGIPGMEGIIRRRDLPNFYRTDDLNIPIIQLVLKEAKHIPLAQGLIFNTFQELEAPVLSQFQNISPQIYAVGPLHTHLKSRSPPPQDRSTSIWKEDKSCISWLDSQPSKSVLFVSIGSLAVVTKRQLVELWHGLINSGTRFLWVQRPDSVVEDNIPEFDEISLELLKNTKERGFIVKWAPQEEVLAHPAVGGFFTHSGWNSTLESIVEGKPMICWPYFVDQQVNSRFVEEVWKLGLDMKDKCDRRVIEGMIRELMGSRKEEFSEKADAMAKLARKSVGHGGSSFLALDCLVEDIKFMRIPRN
ncbi:7-deoxyloganetic acid glucosyltransferase-like [Andrographis paniculata]|uniref:7-deoxyloganetic acid glucosyltransferase-like n=1 Tax=Andrographis paniculata TaxID=175694 RepID=UPI0021E81629|nr:7-deoxyloganetic acid glucosyltransferase-like [Andrographis paniculata]